MTALQDGVQRVNDEAGGLLTMLVVRPTDLPGLVLDALGGSDAAAQLLRQALDTTAAIEAAPRRRPMLCARCPRGLRGRQYAIVVVHPACDAPSTGLALAVCPKCGPDLAAIRVAAHVALQRVWPDLRPVVVTHPGGQA